MATCRYDALESKCPQKLEENGRSPRAGAGAGVGVGVGVGVGAGAEAGTVSMCGVNQTCALKRQ